MKNSFISIVILPILILSCGSDKGHSRSHVNDEAEAEVHNTAKWPEYTLITLKKENFNSVIKTGGRIMTDRKGITAVTARSSGIVKYAGQNLLPGVKTHKGQKLFSVSGAELAEGNTEIRFRQLKSDFDKARADFQRAETLIANRIISQEHYLEKKNNFEKLLAEYNNLDTILGLSGEAVLSPADGSIKEVYVTEGQLVSAGQQLATVLAANCFIIKADLSPEFHSILPSIESANFRVAYSDKLFNTEDLHGIRISSSLLTGENSFYIPVYFRIDYVSDLIEGTYADIYLKGKEKQGTLVVPNSAIMEEFGKLYVYVMDEDGEFRRRYILAGATDGERTEVVHGLNENETIAATGTYSIKLSQMGGSSPAHSHNH